MRTFVIMNMLLMVLLTSGCASSKSTWNTTAAYERRKELSDEKFEFMKSAGMNNPNGLTSSTRGGQW